MPIITDPNLLRLSRLFTQCDTNLKKLKPELMDQYSPLILLLHQSLEQKNKRGKLLLPELCKHGNESIGIFSDYGGESPDSRYYSYSFLISGLNHSSFFQEEIHEIRTKHRFSEKTEMCLKHLKRDKRLRSCLPEYLDACDWIAGLLFTVLVDKKILTLFGDMGRFEKAKNEHNDYICKTLQDAGFGDRKPKIAEKLLRIMHTSAFLTGLLSCDEQKLLWFSDNDAIVANKNTGMKTFEFFKNLLPVYSDHNYGEIIWSTPSYIPKEHRIIDFLNITDLAAGAVERFMTKRAQNNLSSLTNEVDLILEWLGRQGLGLKRHTILIELDQNGNFIGSELQFNSSKPFCERNILPIHLKIS